MSKDLYRKMRRRRPRNKQGKRIDLAERNIKDVQLAHKKINKLKQRQHRREAAVSRGTVVQTAPGVFEQTQRYRNIDAAHQAALIDQARLDKFIEEAHTEASHWNRILTPEELRTLEDFSCSNSPQEP